MDINHEKTTFINKLFKRHKTSVCIFDDIK